MGNRMRGEEVGGKQCTLPAKPRHITMAVFPVFCPSEPNQIFYYIILQFLPPISLGSPRASVAPSAEEMFPLQPSVVMEGTYWKSKQEQEERAEGRSPGSGQAPLWPGITALWKDGTERGELVH